MQSNVFHFINFRKMLTGASLFVFVIFFHLLFQVLFVRFAYISGSKILFYNGVFATFLSSALCLLFLFFKKLRSFGISEFISIVVSSASVSISFFVIVPVTFDRSVSVFLLNKIIEKTDPNTGNSAMSVEELSRVFVGEYVYQNGAIQRRMFEQKSSGNVQVSQDGFIAITERGRWFLNFGRAVSSLYGPADPLIEKSRSNEK